ncbi:hypothetical protein HQ865_03435 [Mucilaginibacter mali]|uniref:Acyl carrier protein n=1 Tax=Mucilaginibacter mali TaxID=2740462 RepID=A0A7D4Q6T8_9SPHI|nr:hypothetical protein [Mucilaginibacter mali]QKJ28845.1 hypothetical protein HQ865_03435 [Mucilaginibacter mali]
MPTIEEVTAKVIAILAEKANLDPEDITDYTKKLTEFPLNLDSTALGFIAITLREYMEDILAGATITSQEVKASGLTVKKLIALVCERLGVAA